MVKANDVGNPMVVINRIHPIYVSFTVPEAQLEQIKRHQVGGKLPVEATVTGQPGGTVRGRLTFVDNTVDPTTGTIRLKATFANTENPSGRASSSTSRSRSRASRAPWSCPAEAVQTGQQGAYVFVVKDDPTVESRPVTTGSTDGGRRDRERPHRRASAW